MTEVKQRPTFLEWLEAHPPKCKRCENLLPSIHSFDSYRNGKINKLKDADGEKVKGLYCHLCVDKAYDELVDSRFVEEYKGERIFHKDGKYMSYWGCSYYFKNLEECRIRIDHSDLAIMPWGATVSKDRVREVLGLEE